MKVYKTSTWSQMSNMLWYVVGMVFLYFVVRAFTDNALYYIGIPLVVAVYPIYCTLFSDNISFEITDDNHLVVKRRGKTVNDFRCDEIDVGFKFVTGSDEDMQLYVTDLNNAEKHVFDCELLGENRFRELLKDLGAYNPDKPIKI